MSTAKVINLVHPSGSTNNLVLDNAGNVVGGGTIADSTAILRPKVLGTPVASTSGTSIDFTGIPSWAKRVTVMLNGVSLSGTSVPVLQVGSSSGGIESTGYTATIGNRAGEIFPTTYMQLWYNGATSAAYLYTGIVTLGLINNTGNIWVGSGLVSANSAAPSMSNMTKSISSILDRVRITTANGTDTFDAGSINIMYE